MWNLQTLAGRRTRYRTNARQCAELWTICRQRWELNLHNWLWTSELKISENFRWLKESTTMTRSTNGALACCATSFLSAHRHSSQKIRRRHMTRFVVSMFDIPSMWQQVHAISSQSYCDTMDRESPWKVSCVMSGFRGIWWSKFEGFSDVENQFLSFRVFARLITFTIYIYCNIKT